MKPSTYKLIGDSIAVLSIVWWLGVMGVALTVLIRGDEFVVVVKKSLPDASVYRLSKTEGGEYAGELRVECLNGGDATVRPTGVDHTIIVSCGK